MHAQIRGGHGVALGSSQKKYINLASGTKSNKDLLAILREVKDLGFKATLIEGPFLLATNGGTQGRPTAMPLQSSSVYASTKEMLTEAYEASNKPEDPDPDIEISRGEETKWSSHSLRRLASTTARRYRHVTGSSEADIDIYFGWHEKILLRAMQRHYATFSIRERMECARITGMM